MKTLVLPFAMVCGLAACDGAPTETDQAAAPDAPEIAAPAPPETSTVSPSPAASTIPAVIQGRWGLVAADCEPGRDDAKGLLTISANELDFYESVGTLDERFVVRRRLEGKPGKRLTRIIQVVHQPVVGELIERQILRRLIHPVQLHFEVFFKKLIGKLVLILQLARIDLG